MAPVSAPSSSPEQLVAFGASADAVSSPPPFRPVQFLGTKARALPSLLEAAEPEIGSGSRVADIFCGSSVVAQGFAQAGHTVVALDALEHCVHFARALLGVGRDGEGSPTAVNLPETDMSWAEAWERWLQVEDAAVAEKDADSLMWLNYELPQIWRPTGAASDLTRLFKSLHPTVERPAGLASAHYAGAYFGLRQAIEIDVLRSRIAKGRDTGCLTPWQESVMLTALLSAASECAFSAGKHYAQPHRIHNGKDLAFIRRRIVEDRRKPVSALFSQRLVSVAAAARDGGDHNAFATTLEGLVRTPEKLGEVDAIYADPPYTAQQYSRFYHVPEVITSYRVPVLQRVRGHVTRGLYPADRHKSRFCSRQQAPRALADLCQLAIRKRATLLVSYSYSRSGDTGNRRSIDLDQLRSILDHHFDNVTERELDFSYRQFNAASASVDNRSDVEILLIGRPRD